MASSRFQVDRDRDVSDRSKGVCMLVAARSIRDGIEGKAYKL
jgi:hypothetical protein